ncbi:MAG: carbonic anhydrase [Verrucomicrobiota bacterium]|jgi:carbonic anhydrase
MNTGKLFVLAIIGIVNAELMASEPSNSEAALQQLREGNDRFIAGKPLHIGDLAERRAEVAKNQKPFAVLVSCSDSRGGPEIIFDQSLGDIFVVRTAGNVVAGIELGSVEYAVEHLGASLIMVLGHTRCGAVAAAVSGGEAHGHLPSILDLIKPAVEKTKNEPGDPIENAMRENVRQTVTQLKNDSPVLTDALRGGKLRIVGARYDLDTGRVELLD